MIRLRHCRSRRPPPHSRDVTPLRRARPHGRRDTARAGGGGCDPLRSRGGPAARAERSARGLPRAQPSLRLRAGAGRRPLFRHLRQRHVVRRRTLAAVSRAGRMDSQSPPDPMALSTWTASACWGAFARGRHRAAAVPLACVARGRVSRVGFRWLRPTLRPASAEFFCHGGDTLLGLRDGEWQPRVRDARLGEIHPLCLAAAKIGVSHPRRSV